MQNTYSLNRLLWILGRLEFGFVGAGELSVEPPKSAGSKGASELPWATLAGSTEASLTISK